MIIHTNQKSRKKKKTKRQIEQYNNWLNGVKETSLNLSGKSFYVKESKQSKIPSLQPPPGRELVKAKSVDTGHNDTFAKPKNVYTGDKIIGIGTLHKSNAVPIFNDEDAKDQASMRR
jgi:hypothetical protein